MAPEPERVASQDVRAELQAVTADLAGRAPMPKVVLIGEKGSGKTCLLNLLCGLDKVADNKVSLENILRLKREHAWARPPATSGSMTFEVEIEKCKIKVLDTPGFEEPEDHDVTEDRAHAQALGDALCGSEYLNAVLLVVNGKVPREQPSLTHSLATVLETFPSEILRRVVVVFVRVDRKQSVEFPTGFLRKALDRDFEPIYLENPLATLEEFSEDELRTNVFAPGQTEDDESKASELKREIRTAVKSCNKLLEVLSGSDHVLAAPASESKMAVLCDVVSFRWTRLFRRLRNPRNRGRITDAAEGHSSELGRA